jgi:hypothetical protein
MPGAARASPVCTARSRMVSAFATIDIALPASANTPTIRAKPRERLTMLGCSASASLTHAILDRGRRSGAGLDDSRTHRAILRRTMTMSQPGRSDGVLRHERERRPRRKHQPPSHQRSASGGGSGSSGAGTCHHTTGGRPHATSTPCAPSARVAIHERPPADPPPCSTQPLGVFWHSTT